MEPTTILLEPKGFSLSEKAPWPLELTENEVTLKNGDGEVVVVMRRAESISRLMVFDSGSKVTLWGENGEQYKFKGDRGEGAKALTAYQEFAQSRDPEAVEYLKRHAIRLIWLGAGVGAVCWLFILGMLLVEPFRSMKNIPPVLGWIFYFSWIPALASPFLLGSGVWQLWKARGYERLHQQSQG